MPSYDPDFFNIDPYYDDFDENKKFLKLLFRPGYALQARELTQIQSILQNQIERFGNFVLDDGSMVFGGQITEIPTKVISLSGLSGGGGIIVTELEDKVVEMSLGGGETSYAKIITGIKNPITNEDVIYYQFISGESITGSFAVQGANEGITFSASASGDVSDGLVMFVDSGIRYTNGYFVSHDAQRIGVYQNNGSSVNFSTPNSSVGFNVNKSIVTSEQDSTLKDPASGFYNFNAAGSDRYKIELEIAQRSLTASIDTAAADPFERTDFIEFARVVAGDVIKKEKYADLGALEETFARRTYDESGHYVVDPFELTMVEGTTASNLRSKLDSGKAYVFGYEFETQGSTYLTHQRARGEDHIRTGNDGIQYGYSVGPFVLAKFSNIDDGATGLNLANLQTIYFDASNGYTSQVSSVVDGVRFTVGEYATTEDFLPGATLYFAPIASDLENVSPPGASASISAKIIRVVGTSTEFTVIEVGPPYATGNGWTGGVTSSFETTSPFYVAAGPSFEAGLDYNSYTGSNVSFFATSTALEFTGGVISDSIGSATIRNIQKLSVDTHKIFFDDLSLNTGKNLSTTQRIYLEGNTGNPAFYSAEYPLVTYLNDNTSLVFESPYGEVIKEYKGYDFMINVILEDQSFSSGGWSADLSSIVGLDGLKQIGPNINSSEIFYDLDSSQIVAAFNEDGKVEGELRINGGTDPKIITIQNAVVGGSTLNGNATVVVACQFKNENSISDLRTKAVGATTVSVTLTGPDSSGYYYSYFNTGSENLTDVYEINSIGASITGYILDTGQRDTFYDFSRIKVSSIPSGVTSFDVNVSYFTHSGYGPFVGGQNVGAGSTASYPNYENVPTFASNSGRIVSLRDSLDFRPVRKGTESSFSLTGPYSYISFPYDGYEHSADYEYYLPRIDKITLTKDKQFKVLEGIPSENPLPPADSSNAMTLYKVRFNPYTFDENDVTVIQEDNRRFTMKDIGDLERRIQNIEYYSTLSLLEQEAKNTPVYDNFGLERAKKAILVDQFVGTESSDVGNEDFYCSFDRDTKELKPPIIMTEFDITNTPSPITVASGLTSNDSVVTFDFTTEEYISNDRFNSSRFVNSNIITDFNGVIKLNPHCDPWFSLTKAPKVKSNPEGNNDSWLVGKYAFAMNARFWDYNWFGKDSSVSSVDKKNTSLQKRYKTGILRTDKLGSFTTIGSSISSTPEKILDTTIIPYIRSGSTTITAKGLMPNRLHSIYFDNELRASGITSSNIGEITYSLSITGDTHLTGKKLIRVMDGSTLSNSTSSADAIFYASGTTKDVASLNYIRPLLTRRESSNSENVLNDVLTRDFLRRENKSKSSKDNIAQIFTISSTKHPFGIFTRSVDVHFDSWPTGAVEKNLPVRVLLKPVVNGYPNPSKIIAESSVSDLTTVSGIGSPSEGKVVRFTFDYPIFLEPNDYAIEIESNSSSYSIKTYVLPSSTTSEDSNERESVLDTNIGLLILPKNLGNTQKLNNEVLTFTVNKCVFSGTSALVTYPISGVAFPSELRSNLSGVLLDTRFCNVVFNSRNYTPNTTHVIKESVGSPTQIQVRLIMGSNADVSPAIDLRACNFVFSSYQKSSSFNTERLPNDATDEVSETTGKFRNTTKARYITKTVRTLTPAKNVSVVFDKNEPVGTQIKVYLKKLEPNSATSFDDSPYVELSKTSQDISQIGGDDFTRVEYASLGDLTEFNVFAVKIVFVVSDNTNRYPSIRNLRVIAV
jgi:hypothetical protein